LVQIKYLLHCITEASYIQNNAFREVLYIHYLPIENWDIIDTEAC